MTNPADLEYWPLPVRAAQKPLNHMVYFPPWLSGRCFSLNIYLFPGDDWNLVTKNMILEVLGDFSWSNTFWDVLNYCFVPQWGMKHETEILQNSALSKHDLFSIVFISLEHIVTWVRRQLLACTHPFLANATRWLILLYTKPGCFWVSGSNQLLFSYLWSLFDKLLNPLPSFTTKRRMWRNSCVRDFH